MSKDKLGTKRTCPNCEGKFFDLNKNPLTCPLCKKVFSLEDIIKKRGETKLSSKDVPIELDNDEMLPESSIDNDDDLVEDTSDLSDDNDDMSDVIDNIERDDSDNM